MKEETELNLHTNLSMIYNTDNAYHDYDNNVHIYANKIQLGKSVLFGKNVRVYVRGTFKLGDYSRFGDDVEINAQEVEIGNHFFHYTSGLRIGGGGSQFSEARLIIGDRCVLHNNKINLANPVTLGNDVGLSLDVDITTHGFWQSVLEGYPTTYKGVWLGNGVIVGQRSIIMPGAYVCPDIVIGAQSVVIGVLEKYKSIYAGNPAKFVREITTPSEDEKRIIFLDMMLRYSSLANLVHFSYDYPIISANSCDINVETRKITGIEDEETDKLRDFLRRYGIRIYTERPFKSL